MSRWIFFAASAALLMALAAPAAARAEADVVAVLYFDNNTGDSSFDVLQKGFADMMITDLSAVDGITVVERDKLQALIDEIKLQQGSYFDPSTAVRLGKGLGARYAVTGAFAAVAPKVRVDMRMVDVATGSVVVATQVTGSQSELFDLEQKLVKQFVDARKARFSPPTMARTRVPDLKTLLDYSKGIDLADRGNYEDASKTLSIVVQRAPTFALARMKRDDYIKRLKEASERRRDIKLDYAETLAKHTEAYLQSHPFAQLKAGSMPVEQAKTYLAYRLTRGHFIARALAKQLTQGSPSLVTDANQKEALKLIQAYYANGELFLQEAAAYMDAYFKGAAYVDTSFELPEEDERLAEQIDMAARSLSRDIEQAKHELAEFLLLGRAYDGKSSFTVAPTPADLIPRFGKIGYQLLDEVFRSADQRVAKEPHKMHTAAQALSTYADALFLRNQRDQGIAKLQEILDRYPTYSSYDYVEKRIKQQLGLEYEHHLSDLERYAKGLTGCDDMDLRRGIIGMFSHRIRTEGLAGIRRTVKEVEKHCASAPNLKIYWPYLYSSAALAGASHNDCPFFDEYMARYLAVGGSKSDAEGYRKNYSKCGTASPAGAP